jgi:polyisoprenoid-binding protein YceI
MKQATLSLLVLITAFTVGLNAEPVVYKIDSVHSGISFKIRHFINKVPGTFAEFSGEIHYDKENPGASKAIATVGVKSVDTRNADRDGHLQNEDFFNSSLFPEISFTSTEWTATGENTFTVTGDLTIKDITKPVTLEVIYLGEMEGRGAIRSGWEGKATIKRSEWGMTYGTPAVGDEVEIELNIQAHREA